MFSFSNYSDINPSRQGSFSTHGAHEQFDSSTSDNVITSTKSYGEAPFANYNVYDFTTFNDDASFTLTEDLGNVSNNCSGNATQALHGTRVENTPLSVVYFSDKNVQIIQNHIKDQVRKLTKNKVSIDVDQNPDDLLIAMRAVFLQNARFLPYDLKGQIIELNRKTIKYIIPDIMSSIKQQYYYVKHITTPIVPIDLPINVNTAGRKTLPSTFIGI